MPTHLEEDWKMEIQHNPEEPGEPYRLYFFLGPVPPSPLDWQFCPSQLFQPITSWAPHTVQEFHRLNNYLEEHCGSEVKDGDVIPYLREHLSWRVKQIFGDEEIKMLKFKSLKVVIHGLDSRTTIIDGADET